VIRYTAGQQHETERKNLFSLTFFPLNVFAAGNM
jgi:hypothetical protein